MILISAISRTVKHFLNTFRGTVFFLHSLVCMSDAEVKGVFSLCLTSSAYKMKVSISGFTAPHFNRAARTARMRLSYVFLNPSTVHPPRIQSSPPPGLLTQFGFIPINEAKLPVSVSIVVSCSPLSSACPWALCLRRCGQVIKAKPSTDNESRHTHTQMWISPLGWA